MSSAIRNASSIEVRFSITCIKRSFGITMSVSTLFSKTAMPSSARAMRFLPSKPKGLVTTATVKAPISCIAISATTGAAPVPVPPPSPAVTKTMSAPAKASRISLRDSSAAWQPTSGLAPAPRPRVSSSPIWTVRSASHMSNAWRSVLMAINSTPLTPASTIRFTALVPPPPTPTTFITAR